MVNIKIAETFLGITLWGAILYIYPSFQKRKINSVPEENKDELLQKHSKTMKRIKILWIVVAVLVTIGALAPKNSSTSTETTTQQALLKLNKLLKI